MGKKDKNPKAAEKKARKQGKQGKKAAQKEKKVKAKTAEDSDADDVDLDSVLEEYARQQAQFLKVTESPCEAPPPRSAATIIASPTNANELLLFGGEYYDGSLATFYNDLCIYQIDRGEWRKVTSPNSPLPRSGHAWCRGGNTKDVYLFGGEFSSPKQGTFYHYNDFWKLDPSAREWTRLESKGKGPPARSGHRMAYFKNYIILFGGFQDTSVQTKYLQDVWIYDCQAFTWHSPVLPPATQKPDPRSSFSFLPHESGAVLYGGYSRVKSTTAAGKQSKGGNQGVRSILKPVIHQDTWFLRVSPPQSDSLPNSPPNIRWERRKKPANAPNPPRAGITMAYHKGRGIMFGGVHDVEESEEGIDSEFFNHLFAWNIERNRFFQLTLKQPKRQSTKQSAVDRSGMRRARGKADEAELLRNLAALDTKGSITDEAPMPMDMSEDIPEKLAKPLLMTMPHPRFNTQLAVQDDILYLFGGTFEKRDKEFTFDEMWAIDLSKLDGVKQIYCRELENWNDQDEESDSEEDDGSDSEDEDIEEDSASIFSSPQDTETVTTATDLGVPDDMDMSEVEPPEFTPNDYRPHPRPFESLRDFFTRTTNSWQEFALEALKQDESAVNKSIKELKKNAFDLAETTWWDFREEIRALEEQQEESGIGEIVNVDERGTQSGSSGRRR